MRNRTNVKAIWAREVRSKLNYGEEMKIKVTVYPERLAKIYYVLSSPTRLFNTLKDRYQMT